MENFSGRSYTQRVGAANAAVINQAPSGTQAPNHFSQNSILKQQPAESQELDLSGGNKETPRKKVIKLVSGTATGQNSSSQKFVIGA
jgi:hypothetical protein